MAADTRAEFIRQLERIDVRIARAFEQAILDIKSVAQERLLVAAIERGDLEGIVPDPWVDLLVSTQAEAIEYGTRIRLICVGGPP